TSVPFFSKMLSTFMAVSSRIPAEVECRLYSCRRQVFYVRVDRIMPTFVSKERINRRSLLGSVAVCTRRSLVRSECHNLQKVPFHGAVLETPDARDQRPYDEADIARTSTNVAYWPETDIRSFPIETGYHLNANGCHLLTQFGDQHPPVEL